ncbi:DUF1810 family protein (plasmid) [Burkholderia pyrrocinia]|uniref:DUF1810 family protein n=1 Tax=Burkholderia pyrrocinia TaxID=60550 RepID=UPI0038B53CBF
MSESIPSVGLGAFGRSAITPYRDLGATGKPFRRDEWLDDGFRGLADYSKVRVSERGRITLVSLDGHCQWLSADHFGRGQKDITSHEAGELLRGIADDGVTVLHRLAGINVCSTEVDNAACIHALLNRAETFELNLADVAQAYERVSAVYRQAVDNVQCESERQAVLCEEAAVVAMQAAQSYVEAKMPERAAKLYGQVAKSYRQIASLIEDQEIEVDGNRQATIDTARAMAEGASELEYESCLCAFDERSVQGDGNCFFTALKESGDLGQGTDELRGMVAKHLQSNSVHYASFFEGADPSAVLAATASQLARDGEWRFGDTVPQLMSAALRRPIHILDTQRKRTVHALPPEPSCGLDPITIFYNGKDHYNAAIPKRMDAFESEAGSRFKSTEGGRLIGRKYGASGAPCDLTRFVSAQDEFGYETALKELHAGQKATHWMWYMFPQFQGLGASERTQRFAITSLPEAAAYLSHPVLGARVTEMTRTVNRSEGRSIEEIFGDVDSQKFHASMTLFSKVAHDDNRVFADALEKYFGGTQHQRTLDLLNSPARPVTRSTGLS